MTTGDRAAAAAGRTETAQPPPGARARQLLLRLVHLLHRLVTVTVASCIRHRVTGLAAEAAFFAVLSLPPLVFALAGAIGFVTERFPPAQVTDIRQAVLDLSNQALTDTAVERVIAPTIDEVLGGGRFDVISIGFVLALWSGSRALNVFVDSISIMHGLGGQRGIISTRMLSFALYVMGLVTGMVAIPLVVAGPRLAAALLPDELAFLRMFYWPVVVVVCICFLATLYHVSVPVRTAWSFNLPGAVFSLLVWIGGSSVLRWTLTVTAAESSSVYGPLSAPIAVLLWLYLLAIAVLIGAAVNAAFDEVLGQQATQRARRELAQRLRRVRVRTRTRVRTSRVPARAGADEPAAAPLPD